MFSNWNVSRWVNEHRAHLVISLAAMLTFGILAGCSEISPLAPQAGGNESVPESQTIVKPTRLDDSVEPEMATGPMDEPVAADKAGRVLTMYATQMYRPDGHWANANGALGAPVANDNQNANLFAYNDVMGSTYLLRAEWFNVPALLPREVITGVYVDVNARYDAGTSANAMRLSADYIGTDGLYHRVARDATWTQTTSDDLFRWRMGGAYGWNITSLRPTWTINDVWMIELGARRFPNNDFAGTSRARVNAFKITITTAIL
ncbi:MAG: hypothetical protein IPG61_08095 [bacterium]|nr:hypothetical protein [bacterium]